MIQGVIFDIDGTIIDSAGPHIESWRRTFQHFDKDPSYESLRPALGKGADEFLSMFLSRDALARLRSDLEKYRSELYKRDICQTRRHFPGSGSCSNG
jgi:beta-phosphoglucomutase-like phosphatase (HAD superfamily)